MKRFNFLFLILIPLLSFSQSQTDTNLKSQNNTTINGKPYSPSNASAFNLSLIDSKTSRTESYSTTGTNTYSVTVPWFPGYIAGVTIQNVIFQNANTSTSSLNVNTAGAVNLYMNGQAVASGQICAGCSYDLYYDGTKFQMKGGGGGSNLNGIGFVKVLGTTISYDNSTYSPTSRSISTTSPLSGGGDLSANRTISISQANGSTSGYLSASDWTTLMGKQAAITLTTTGTNGAATFISNTLNIPNYTASGLGALVASNNLSDLSNTSTARTNLGLGTIATKSQTSGTAIQKGDGSGGLTAATSGTDYQAPITFGTGVQSALGNNIGSVGAPVLFNGALGTPSSGTLTNATGLPISGLSGLGAGWSSTLSGSAPSGTSSQLLGNNGSNGFSNVTVGGGLNYSGGILSASVSSSFYGSILNQTSFSNTTGFTNVGGTTLTIVSNSIQFSGGGGTATSLAKHLDYNYTSGLEYVRVTGVFTVQGTVNTTSYGFGLGNLGFDSSHGTVGVRFNMTTINGGQLTLIDGTGAGTVMITSPTNCTFSLNDQIELVYERREDQILCTAKNLTAGGSAGIAQITWSYNSGAAIPLQPTTGKYGIYYFGGTFSLNSLSIYSNEIKNADLLIVGDSKVNGYVAPHVTRFATLLRNNTNKTVVSAGGSETIANAQSKSAEIIALNPKKILLMIGSNDVRAASPTVNSDYSALVTTFTNAGIDVYCGLLWEDATGGGVDQSSLNTYIQSTYPTKYIDTYSVLNTAMLATDKIHPNETGNQFIYKRLLQSGLIDNPKSDYTPYQRYYFTNSNQAEYISIFNEATSSTAQAGFKMTVGTDVSGSNSNYIRTTTTGNAIPNALITDVRTSGGYVLTMDGSTKNYSMTSSGVSAFLGTVSSSNHISLLTSTATAAGTTTLTVSSNYFQTFTGTTTQTVVLPVATTMVAGQGFRIVNNSTGSVTVNTSGGNTIKTLSSGNYFDVWIINAAGGTGTASWNWTPAALINN